MPSWTSSCESTSRYHRDNMSLNSSYFRSSMLFTISLRTKTWISFPPSLISSTTWPEKLATPRPFLQTSTKHILRWVSCISHLLVLTMSWSELRRPPVPGAAWHPSTGAQSAPGPGQWSSVHLMTTNGQETWASSELFLGNWGRANLPKPGTASVSLPGSASSNGTSGTHLSKSLESQRHKYDLKWF